MAGEKRERSPASSASSDESRGRSPRGNSTSPVQNSSAPRNSKPSSDPAEKNSSKRGKSLSVDVCKDFTKGRCKRSPLDCKYAHPSSAVAVEENKVTVCFDSLRDRCLRGASCRYYHPSPRIRVSLQEAAGIQPTTVPLGYQINEIRSSNLFFGPPHVPHPLPVLSPPPLKTTNKLSVEVCRDYLRGRCSREADECRYAHHAPTDGQGEHVTVCADYLRGKCERSSCRYFHAPDHLRSRIRDAPVEPAATFNSVQYNLGMDTHAFHPRSYDEQPVKRMKTRDYADDYFSRGLAAQQYEAPVFQVPAISGPQLVPPPVLRFSEPAGKQIVPPINGSSFWACGCLWRRMLHLRKHLQAWKALPVHVWAEPESLYAPKRIRFTIRLLEQRIDEDRMPVCRDYQKSKCSRDSSCKYAHPEPHTQVVDNYVNICRDFQRGKCRRESCRFYHHSKQYGNHRNGRA